MASTLDTTAASGFPEDWTLADFHPHPGAIPLERIHMRPVPGTATEEDAIQAESRYGWICELIDGVLVEETMGYFEGRLAILIGHFIESCLEKHPIGICSGADGILKPFPGQIRVPDVSFVSEARLPGGKVPREPAPALAPEPGHRGALAGGAVPQGGVGLAFLKRQEFRSRPDFGSPRGRLVRTVFTPAPLPRRPARRTARTGPSRRRG